MNKYCKSAAIILGFLATASLPVFAASGMDNAGTSASAFLKIGAGSPRAQALGNANVSLTEGAEALFWNPAGASTAVNKEFKVAYLDWLQGFKAATVAFAQPLGKTVLGITGTYMTMNDFDGRDINGVPIHVTDVRNFIGSVSLARGFIGNALQLGVTGKYISEDNDGDQYSNMALDAGAKIVLGKFGLGAAVINIGDKDEVPFGIRGGAHLGTRYFTLAGEVIKYVDYRMQYGFGVEIHIPEDVMQVARFDLRIGYYTRENTGTNYDDDWLSKIKLDRTSRVSFGFGLYSGEVFGYGASLDYAMTPFGALGTAQQLSVGIQF
jgi:hypothetical protein